MIVRVLPVPMSTAESPAARTRSGWCNVLEGFSDEDLRVRRHFGRPPKAVALGVILGAQPADRKSVSMDILDSAASLWVESQRLGRVVGDCDLIVAATAEFFVLRLVTSNTKHFDWIRGLQLCDWRKPLGRWEEQPRGQTSHQKEPQSPPLGTNAGKRRARPDRVCLG
jgi:hypothetical protein